MKTTASTTVSLRTNRKSSTRRKSGLHRILAASIATFGMLSLAPLASAVTITKANNGTNLDTGASWVGGIVPTGVDIALFNATVATAANINGIGLGSNQTWGQLQLTNPAGPLVIVTGFALTLNGVAGTGIDLSAATQNFTFDGSGLTVANTQFWNAATGRTITVTANAPLTLNLGADLKPNGAGNTVINGAVSGAGGILKLGTGNLTLSGAVNLSGPGSLVASLGTMTVNGTTSATTGVTVNSATLAGTGTINSTAAVLLNGGTINFGAGATIANNLTVTGGAWNGLGTVNGIVNVNSGNLNIGAAGNLTTTQVNVTNASTFSASAGTSTITGNVNYTSSTNSTFGGVIAGATSSVTVNNPGVGKQLILTGTNTYGGVTTVAAGALNIANNSGLGQATGVAGDGTVVLNGGVLYLRGVTIGNEALTINGFGNAGFPGSSEAALVGFFGPSIWGGLITLGSDSAIGVAGAVALTLSGGIVNDGRTLTLKSTALTPGTITVNTAAINGASANSNLIVDHVTVNENVANTYNGATTIRSNRTAGSGILNANVANALPTANGRSAVTMDDLGLGGSRLNLGANQAIASLTGAATSLVNLNANTLTTGTAAGTTTFAGIISGAGSFTKDGASTQVLTGQSTYLGATNVFDGVLSLGVANAIPVGTVLNVGSAAGSAAGLQVNLNGNNQTISALNFTIPTSFQSINLGGATLTLTGDVTMVSNTTTPASGGSSNINFSGGGGALDLGGAVRTFSLTGTGNFSANGDLQIGATIQNGGITLNQIAPAANGTPASLELMVANTYAGLTTVNSGVLRIRDSLGLGTTAAGTVVEAGGTLQLGAGTNVVGEALSLSGTGATSGGSPLGALNVESGTATYGGAITLAGDATISAGTGKALTLTGGINKNGVNLTLGGTTAANAFGTINVNSVISGAAANSDLVVDSATTNLNAANTYNGATFIRSTALAGAGILNANVAGALPDPNFGGPARSAVTMDDSGLGGSTLNIGPTADGGIGNTPTLGAAQAIASLVGTATSGVTLGNNTLTIGFGTAPNTNGTAGAIFAGVISGLGGLIKDDTSTQVLSGTNTFTGPTNVNGGILSLSGGQALADTNAVTVTTPGVLDVQSSETIGSLAGTGNTTIGTATLTTGGNNTSTTYSGTITGTTGGVTKEGTGIWTLDGAGSNTFSGPFNVNDGTVQLNMGGSQATGQGTLNIGDGIGAAGSAVLQLLQSSEINNTSAVTIAADGRFDVNGFTETIGSLAGSGSTTLGAGTLFTGGNDASTAYSGAFSGTGSVTKNGTGIFTLTGTSTHTGGTTLNAGTLQAGNTKAFGSGNLTVNGGTLQTVGGPRIVNIGNGNVAINGGIVVANVGGTLPGVNHDQLLTTGIVGAISGTLALVQQNGYLLAPGDKVHLVQAGAVTGGSVNGTPVPNANVTGLAAFSNTPLLVPTVSLFLTTVTLEAIQGSFAGLNGTIAQGVLLNFTPNQIAVATALDSLQAQTVGKTGLISELNYLDTQPLSTLQGNLDKIAPEELTSIFNASVAIANVSNLNLQRRMEDIRIQSQSGQAAFSANVITGGPAQGGERFAGGPQGPVGRRSKQLTPPSSERWGMFVTGAGEFTHIGSTTNASGYNLQTGGVTAGLDYRVTDHLAIGLNLGYANTTASLVNGGSLGVDGGTFGLYATWFDQNFHVDAAVSGGINSYRTRRVTPNNTLATGSPNGTEFNALIAIGYDWKSGALTFGPTASFQYTNTSLDSFTEAGAFAPLTIQGKSSESLRTSVGVRAYYEGKIGSVGFRPEVRLAWQHEAGATGNNLTSNFATLGGRPFTVAGTTVGRDSLVASAGFIILWNDRLATYVYYDGNFGAKNQESHNISAGVRLQF